MHPFLGAFAPSFGAHASDTTTPSNATTTTSGTAYNNITPVQLIASTQADASWFSIQNRAAISATGARSDTVFEIMAGAGGSEYTIIGPVAVGNRPTNCVWHFPIFIPGGTRLSIRVRSARLSTGISWNYHIGYGGINRDSVGYPQRWIAYGLIDDASSDAHGTIVAPGNAVWGSWTSLTTSTTYAHDLWMPMVDGGTATTMTALTTRTRWAIASTADAATMATNATLWNGPWVSTTTAEVMNEGLYGTGLSVSGGLGGPNGIFYHPAPAGSAVSAAGRCSAAPNANALGCSILAAL